MPPAGTGDTHYSLMRGTKTELIIRQNQNTKFRPVLFVKVREGQDVDDIEKALTVAIQEVAKKYPGIGMRENDQGWEIVVPKKYEIGHEAHFSQVMQMYIDWLKNGAVPKWEMTNILVKYYTLSEAWKMSR
jgi:hypothetical protein